MPWLPSPTPCHVARYGISSLPKSYVYLHVVCTCMLSGSTLICLCTPNTYTISQSPLDFLTYTCVISIGSTHIHLCNLMYLYVARLHASKPTRRSSAPRVTATSCTTCGGRTSIFAARPRLLLHETLLHVHSQGIRTLVSHRFVPTELRLLPPPPPLLRQHQLLVYYDSYFSHYSHYSNYSCYSQYCYYSY